MNTRFKSEPLGPRIGLSLLLRCCLGLSLLAIAFGTLPGSRPSASAGIETAPTTTRPELVLQTGHAMRIKLAFSPDGTLLASGSADNTVKLWDTASRREVRIEKAVAFRPDGQWLASGGVDGNIFWEVATGSQLRIR